MKGSSGGSRAPARPASTSGLGSATTGIALRRENEGRATAAPASPRPAQAPARAPPHARRRLGGGAGAGAAQGDRAAGTWPESAKTIGRAGGGEGSPLQRVRVSLQLAGAFRFRARPSPGRPRRPPREDRTGGRRGPRWRPRERKMGSRRAGADDRATTRRRGTARCGGARTA